MHMSLTGFQPDEGQTSQIPAVTQNFMSLCVLSVLQLKNNQLPLLRSELDPAFVAAGVSAQDSERGILGSVCSLLHSDHADGDSSEQRCWHGGVFIGKQKLGKW